MHREPPRYTRTDTPVPYTTLFRSQRFLRRARAYVQQAVRDSLKDRSIKELDKEGQISIQRDVIHEPTLHRAAQGGSRERVFPGNHDYMEGDKIKRPDGGAGAGSKAGQGEGNDDFQFALSREEDRKSTRLNSSH